MQSTTCGRYSTHDVLVPSPAADAVEFWRLRACAGSVVLRKCCQDGIGKRDRRADVNSSIVIGPLMKARTLGRQGYCESRIQLHWQGITATIQQALLFVCSSSCFAYVLIFLDCKGGCGGRCFWLGRSWCCCSVSRGE